MGLFNLFGSGTVANGVFGKEKDKSNAGCGCLCLLGHIIIIPLCFVGGQYWYDYQYERQRVKKEAQSVMQSLTETKSSTTER
jgi:hypothetical protein